MAKRERVCLRRFEAEADSIEGKLFHYVNNDPSLMPRQALLRALKAFYLPWVLEFNESERQAIAKTAIQELQYRIFQIQQRFLPEELTFTAPVATFPVGQTAIAFQSQAAEEPMLPITLAQMREAIDSATLEQVLDDF
jgi:hypothetical protein